LLADEWLTPAEQEASNATKKLAGIRQERRRTWQTSLDKDSREDFTFQDPPLPAPSLPSDAANQPPSIPPNSTTTVPLTSSWNRDRTSTNNPSSVTTSAPSPEL